MSNLRYISDFKQLNLWLAKKTSAVLLCDDHSLKYCKSLMILPEDMPVIVVPPGEAFKQLDQCSEIWSQLIAHNAKRSTELIILGGGVLCDMGGLCASLYMRGMPFSFIPTTLLAMCDAAHGGKLAVDFGPLKNYIGAFKEAKEIVIFTEFLRTLPERHLGNGWVEMLKHALIADLEHWERLMHSKPANLIKDTHLLQQSVAIKRRVVEEDPFEQGKRKILNAGHTIGHAIESSALSQKKDVLHGEAVAAGLMVELLISEKLSKLSSNENEAIFQSLLPFLPDKFWLATLSTDNLWQYALKDKKNMKEVAMSLIGPPGHCSWDNSVSFELFQACWQKFLEKING